MNFKDALYDDLEGAFFDQEEFASQHTIDGANLNVILLDISFKDALKNDRKNTINTKEHAINKNVMVIHIKEKDIRRKLSAGATINLDGERMWISSVKHTEGMVSLQVERHKV